MPRVVPVALENSPWSIIDDVDIKSVRVFEKLTNQAVFMILYQKVEKANETAGKMENALFSLDFVTDFVNSTRQKKKRPPPEQYRFFHDEENNKRVLIPILQEDHFFLLSCEELDGQNTVFVMDSIFTSIIEEKTLRQIAKTVDTKLRDCKIVFLTETEIQRQNDAVSCGVFVVIFAEHLISVGMERFKTNKKRFNISKERMRLYKCLKYSNGPDDDGNNERNEKNKTCIQETEKEEEETPLTVNTKQNGRRRTPRSVVARNCVGKDLEMEDSIDLDPTYDDECQKKTERTSRYIVIKKTHKKMQEITGKRRKKSLSMKSCQNRYRMHTNGTSARAEFKRIREFVKKDCVNSRVLHEQLFQRLKSIVEYWDEVLSVRFHDSTIRRTAIRHASAFGIRNFKASKTWIWKFKKRLGLVSRHIDRNVSKITANNANAVAKSVEDFKIDVVPYIRNKYALDHIYNADQTPIQGEMTSNRTLTKKGTKLVQRVVQRDYATKHTFTAHIRADGKLSDRLFVLLQERVPPASFASMVAEFTELEVHHTRSGIMTSDLAEVWIESLMTSMPRRCAMLIDSWTGYTRMKELSSTKKKGLEFIVFPKKTTSELQPLDLFFNRHFKTFVRFVADYVLLNHPSFILSRRKNIIAVLQFTWNQFKSDKFNKYGMYGWYLMGLVKTKPTNFQTPAQYCFQNHLLFKSVCSIGNCSVEVFVKCAYCDKLYCFLHSLKHIH